MGRMLARHKNLRPSDAAFDYTNRALQATPLRDTDAERADKEKKIAEFLARKAATEGGQ